MKRLTEAWFEFKGVKSSDMGVLLRQMPTRTLAARNYTRTRVAGRDGSIALGDGCYGDVSVKIECSVPDASKLGAVLAWLSGSGALRFSDEPNLTYDASVEKEYSRASILNRCEGQRFTVTWTCAPIRRLCPAAADITITTSGTGFTALGTYFALPKLAIYGSGAFSVTISGGGHSSSMFFTGVPSDGIVVDSELMDALTMDGAGLLNRCILSNSDDFFRIWPGTNVLSWGVGSGDEEEIGSISKIIITPRWRWL